MLLVSAQSCKASGMAAAQKNVGPVFFRLPLGNPPHFDPPATLGHARTRFRIPERELI
jgi:hypothetical protein